jgi:Helix-turn-helix domain
MSRVDTRPGRLRWRSAILSQESPLGPWARLTAAALAEYASKGRCWPSEPTLANCTGLSERTIRDAIAELERLGFLAIARRAGITNTYELCLPRQDVPESPWQDVQGSIEEPRQRPRHKPGHHVPTNQITRYPDFFLPSVVALRGVKRKAIFNHSRDLSAPS